MWPMPEREVCVRAIFLYNNGQDYQDAAQEAEATWSTLGGAVADRAIIPSNVSDYSELISRLLGLDASKKRVGDIEQIIASSSITGLDTRVRPDLDVIFMFTDKVTARVLKPQLDFHKAEGFLFMRSILFSVANPM